MIFFLSTSDTDLLAAQRVMGSALDGLPPLYAAAPTAPGLLDALGRQPRAVVLLRLLGGRRACPEAAEAIGTLCHERGFPLLACRAEGTAEATDADDDLDALCTAPPGAVVRAAAYLAAGGLPNLSALLCFLADTFLGTSLGAAAPAAQPDDGVYLPERRHEPGPVQEGRPRVGILFYRAHWLSGNLAFVDALVEALAAEGCDALPVFCSSLRPPAQGQGGPYVLERYFLDGAGSPTIDVLVSTLSFAAGRLGTPSSEGLEAATEAGGPAGEWLARLGVPVLQALVCTDSRQTWEQRAAGLGPLDVGMQVALPEFDGRLITVPICFKEVGPLPGAGTPVPQYVPQPERCRALARQAAAWARLRRLPNEDKRLAIVLGNYPSRSGRVGNAVGLDTPASLVALLEALRAAGYRVADFPPEGDALIHRLIAAGTYDESFGGPADRAAGPPPGLALGNVFVAIQPPRGWDDDPAAAYHDPELPPPGAYVTAYRWLADAPPDGFGAHALLHLGKHGTLEWLPGKSVGLSAGCWPDRLLGDLPLLYPFVVNDPGEGTQAKRRAHAVLLGHLVPPLAEAGSYGDLAALERLIEEERSARTLDPAKLPLLRRQIWQAIRDARLDEDLALPARPEAPDGPGFDHLLERLEAYLQELQAATIRDGLHVLGRSPAGAQRESLLEAMTRLAGADDRPRLHARLAPLLDRTTDELTNLLAALDGRYVAAGPSGTPTRGMWNVLPTGRNFYSVDPQAIPSPAAWETGQRLAAALLARHRQETGREPRTVGLVVWGTAAMRTHGDDVAQALALLGVRPRWQPETGRVTGVEPIPLSELGRARVDVTLHVSGFFRDAFPHLLALLDQAVQLVAGLDEPEALNPLAGQVRRDEAALRRGGAGPDAARRQATYRIFGSKPGCYGAGLLPVIEARNWRTADDLARAYEAWSSYAYGQQAAGVGAPDAFRARFAAIEVAAKNQDNREHDLFDSDDYFQYHGGMVAAARALRADGTAPRAYFGDSADPLRPAVRGLEEEARRVFRSRVVNPRWLAAMRRHGYKGAFEMAATVDYLFGYDATTGIAADWMYERVAHSYLLDPQQRAFFSRSNPWALRDTAERLLEAAARGLWQRPDDATLRELRRALLQVEGDLEARQESVPASGSQLEGAVR